MAMSRTLLIACSLLACGSLLMSTADAALVIDFDQVGTGVDISISGSGTIINASGGNPGLTLDFLNFSSGNPFLTAFNNQVFNLSSNLTITGTDAGNGGAAFTSTISAIRLNSGGNNLSDVNLNGNFSIQTGDTFLATGTATVTGLLFSSLVPGTYTSSSSAGDAAEFGGVTLNINMSNVPEPASLAMMLVACCGAIGIRRRRQRTMTAVIRSTSVKEL